MSCRVPKNTSSWLTKIGTLLPKRVGPCFPTVHKNTSIYTSSRHLPHSQLDSTPTYVVFTIKNTVILLWFATCLTNIQQSSITVVWTILQAQERQRQFYYSSSYLLFLCVIDLHCRCLITLCVIYILCNLYLFMSHPPYYMIYCSPLENYENVPCSLRVIQTMPSK